MDARSTAATLTAFALVGGLLQVLASALLGMERLDQLTLASQEGPWVYLAAATGVTVGLAALWVLRRRVLVAAAVFLTWQVSILWPLSRRMTSVGLALHGEFLLHHFVAMLCVLACAVIALGLARDRSRPWWRWPIAATIAVAVSAASWGHLAQLREAPRQVMLAHGITVIAVLLATGALALLELASEPRSRIRWAAVVLWLPLGVRALASGPFALGQAAVPPGLRAVFLGLLVTAAAALTVLLRPRPPRGIAIVMTGLSALSVATLYLVYRGSFGKLEDGLGPLAQSMLGFTPPYPEYVSTPVLLVVMVGAFLALQTAGGSLGSDDARDRGIGFALVLVAGVGWSSPQLVMMSAAGLLLFLVDLDGVRAPARPPTRPIAAVFDTIAATLALEHTTVAGDGRRAPLLHAVRGQLRGLPLELKAHVRGERIHVGARLGGTTHGRADVVLCPGKSNVRPNHPLARTHRVQGSVRALEQHGEGLLDACLPFPTLQLSLAPTGATLEFGDDLHGFDDGSVVALLRALARSYGD